MGDEIVKEISDIVAAHIVSQNEVQYDADVVFSALSGLSDENVFKKNLQNSVAASSHIKKLSTDNFQTILSKINEKQSHRKKNGVYYTPKDVTRYLVANSFRWFVDNEYVGIDSDTDSVDAICVTANPQKVKKLFESVVFDPTAGAGEFLVSAFEIKCEILEKTNEQTSDDDYLSILSTIKGNDISTESVEISKIRLFFSVIAKLKNSERYADVADILNGGFTTHDFVNIDKSEFATYDIIVGNPPYVEYGKLSELPKERYGNTYANVLQNSVDLLSDEGVMCFVIPISYVSTPRMSGIRKYMYDNLTTQLVLNYADRPDCLFASVHQKLTVMMGCKGREKDGIYSSGYRYWYNSERNELLGNVEVCKSMTFGVTEIPKIGDSIAKSVYKKVSEITGRALLESLSYSGDECDEIYLNMRGYFWMKAFTFSPGSREYKRFVVDRREKSFLLCLLNSSLFWMFWVMISDCWHITRRELSSFIIPETNIDYDLFNRLATDLETKLEQTKEYIGTKQVEYAYKHKMCKAEIDKIDDALQSIYNLTNEELDYVKQYNIKYRTGEGA